jgi:SAM-dependent methyltransferase
VTEILSHTGTVEWACPVCRGSLHPDSDLARCTECRTAYECRDGIWRFLPAQRALAYETFLEQYEVVRRREGWGSTGGDYYRTLPTVPSDDPNRKIWEVRNRTFLTFVRRVLVPLETRTPLRAVDLGAGNGWLAYRLAQRGHTVAAVDLRTDDFDGLGAHVHYDAEFTPVRAEYARLPFADGQFDLAVFNASLHYAEDCHTAVLEALRVLRPGGVLAVLDSPLYRTVDAGRRMVRDRERDLLSRFGFASNSLESEHFLTIGRLEELADATGISWTFSRPYYGIRWMLRPMASFMFGRRQPADFLVIAADKPTGRVPSGDSI